MKTIKTTLIALALITTSMASAAYAESAVKAHSQMRQIRGKQSSDVLARGTVIANGPKVHLAHMSGPAASRATDLVHRHLHRNVKTASRAKALAYAKPAPAH